MVAVLPSGGSALPASAAEPSWGDPVDGPEAPASSPVGTPFFLRGWATRGFSPAAALDFVVLCERFGELPAGSEASGLDAPVARTSLGEMGEGTTPASALAFLTRGVRGLAPVEEAPAGDGPFRRVRDFAAGAGADGKGAESSGTLETP